MVEETGSVEVGVLSGFVVEVEVEEKKMRRMRVLMMR